ncbi:endoglucanase 24-like isoform X2 [Ricinus communis]|uniref:endoglucanase 24-like isoform X2 n=1 Tax=Ricinus communis TaxID=3988 RepID=UPI00201A2398|nr:endoglucanase 24-like isoform X2 [Ricinus communis]
MEGKKVESLRTQDWKQVESAKFKGWGWWLSVLVIGAIVVTACGLTILKSFNHFKKSSGYHRAIVKKYSDALEVSLQFFDIQKSGKLVNNRIPWRGDSGLQDGKQQGLDLSKGTYDAGDLIKFGFPMAFTATMLSWAILEYGEQMNAVKQLGYAQDSLKWITDYLIDAHPSPYVLYIQVGDPELDHNCWQRPETMTEERPVTQVNTSFPGSDVAAETAAAMASASLEFYNSTDFGDELLWAAAWLYHATGDESYLSYATEINGEKFANWGNPTWFSWDDKHAGAQVLLSKINMFGVEGMSMEENLELQIYRETAEAFMCRLLPDSPTATSSRTENGLIWVLKWNPLQYAVASAFLAVLFSDYMVASHIPTLYCSGQFYRPDDLRSFAISQADYVLGKNPMEMSFLVGYGLNFPRYVHHRGSSIPVDARTGCKDGFMWLHSQNPNPNVPVGALVGGPFLNETYVDSRNNTDIAEPTTYSSALFVGLLSALVIDNSHHTV